jgi:ABC-type Fe3+-hydroxamate transport system substrate-binding protein
MKVQRLLFILFISAAFLNACSTGNPSGDVTVLFQPKYAKGFRVVKIENDTVIQFLTHSHSPTVSHSVSDSPTVSHSVSLSEIQPERIALLSTTHSYFINALDGMKNVCGVTYADRVQLQKLQEQISNGRTQNLTRNGDVNLEDLLMLNPTVLFSVPFEPTDYRSKLPGCVVIPTSEYLEEHPLGKAEWIYVFGYVLRKDVLARELFLEIENAYIGAAQGPSVGPSVDLPSGPSVDLPSGPSVDLPSGPSVDLPSGPSVDLPSGPSSDLPSGPSVRPKVFFATNNGSDWTVANNQSYWAILLKDAGAEYVGATEEKGNLNFDKERMLFALNEADAYGELVYFPNTSNVSLSKLHPEFIQTVPFQHKNSFVCNAANNGFFDKALLEPHVLLQELKQVLADTTFSGYYFQRTQ